jgi:arylsulfatase A-like enzyme
MSGSAHAFSRFLLLIALVSSVRAISAADKPNIILIVADDLGANDLGVYGSRFHRTPNLDALAASGARFTQAYAAAPVCSPTRVALMTGQLPARVGLTDWLPGRGDRPDQRLAKPVIPNQLPLEAVTIAEALKTQGYNTWHVGKWHLGGEGYGPEQQGFMVNIAGDHTGTPLSYFSPFGNAAGRKMKGLENAPKGQYLTDRLTDEALALIENGRDKPFFLYMPHYAVHTPMRAKEEMVKTYDASKIPPGRQRNPIYAAMLESLDQSVGRIIKKLEELKIEGNTWIIFTSDNGGLATTEGPNTPATSNAPSREGKGWLYEGGLRVPLIVKGPGVKSAKPDYPIISSDLPATIAEIGGAANDLKALDGKSLASLLKGGPAPDRDELYWHYPHYANQGGAPGGVIRAGNYKLIELYENNRRELFDLSKDVSESRNLSAEMPDKVAELAKKLADWRVAVNARMPHPNPGYIANPQDKNGQILLPARSAIVSGQQLRYEPQPHKNTLGFWVREQDTARWDFTVNTPGEFEVVGLIGCGPGQGGSEVEFIVDESQKLGLTVPDTGGFQAFVPMNLGRVKIANAGLHSLLIKPVKKNKAAVMDVRQITLKPVKP